ncbi:glycosyltransferase [Macrococcus animalis]|uniref:glycosyltransferase n=1 Tax=Macrococcus animalis TaxID=3395467 RepID=UPI0039BDC073
MIPIRKRILDIDKKLAELNGKNDSSFENKIIENTLYEYDKGISLVIPIFNGKQYLLRLISSLSKLNVSKVNVEFLFILNGSDEQIKEDIDELVSLIKSNTFDERYYQILYSSKGAGNARNIGIKHAQFSHILFLDCDDTLHQNTLSHLLKYLDFNNEIILFNIKDVVNGQIESKDNIIQKEKNKFLGKKTNNYNNIPKIISMNGAKLIPTHFLNNHLFDPYLKSGEDIELMMRIIAEFEPIFYIIDEEECIYFRHVEENSVSRQALSYAFNVEQRIQVIERLSQLLNKTDNSSVRELVMNRMDAQASFINKYLIENKSEYKMIISLLKDIDSEYMPYAHINKNLQEVLYVGYCFAPFADTSGVVLSKRIDEIGLPCDVISNDMSDVRDMDLSLKKISQPYIHSHYEINSKSSFSNWNLMQNYIRMGYKKSLKHNYNKLYSRVLWPASHFLAYKIKMKKPKIHWTAEFSDPVLFDIKNIKRESKITSILFLRNLKKNVPERWKKYINTNLFDMTEIIPFIFADELVFTNSNQLKTMISRINDDKLKDEVIKKSKIKPHPTLLKKYYEIEQTLLELDDSKFNIGYFGNFYETRGLKEIYELIQNPSLIEHLNKENKPISFNVFTNDVSTAKSLLRLNDVIHKININQSLSYFEFLNATNKFDALIVMDAHTKEYKHINPYLPSKLSDYLGSEAHIIAFVEPGSPMDDVISDKITKIKISSK